MEDIVVISAWRECWGQDDSQLEWLTFTSETLGHTFALTIRHGCWSTAVLFIQECYGGFFALNAKIQQKKNPWSMRHIRCTFNPAEGKIWNWCWSAASWLPLKCLWARHCLGVVDKLESISADFEREAWYTMDWSPATCEAQTDKQPSTLTLTPRGNFSL